MLKGLIESTTPLDSVKNLIILVLLVGVGLSMLSISSLTEKLDTKNELIGKQKVAITEAATKVKTAEIEKKKQLDRHKQDLELIATSWQRARQTTAAISVTEKQIRTIHDESEPEVKAWGDGHIPDEYLQLLKRPASDLPDGTSVRTARPWQPAEDRERAF